MPVRADLDDTQKIVSNNRTFFCSELIAKAYKTLRIYVSSRSCTTIYPKHFSSKKNLELTNASIGEELLITFDKNN